MSTNGENERRSEIPNVSFATFCTSAATPERDCIELIVLSMVWYDRRCDRGCVLFFYISFGLE